MIRNYFTTIFRRLRQNKIYSFINVLGLSLGLACCMLIFLYTKDEISFDRFHKQKDNIYQLTCTIIQKTGGGYKFGDGGVVQGPTFKREIPEIVDFVRVNNEQSIVKKGNETFAEITTLVDRNFFQIFSFPLIEGNPESVLQDLHSVVLTSAMAIKYFGTEHAVGKLLEVERDGQFVPFVVSGIARTAPQNSSIKFDILLPFQAGIRPGTENSWSMISFSTFFLLRPGSNIQSIQTRMARIYQMHAGKQIEEARVQQGYEDKWLWGLRPFLQIHLDTAYETEDALGTSKPIYSYILMGISFIILAIACINFVNLNMAQSLKRSKEIGIRKVIGGKRRQLIWQFLCESFAFCFISFLLAIILAQIGLPFFNDIANKRLSLGYLLDTKLILVYISLLLIAGIAAGLYPALVLSGFNPVNTLQGRTKLFGRNYVSKVLVVVQFGLASFFIIGTLIVYSQFRFLTHSDLGYNDQNLLVMNVRDGENRTLIDNFRNEFAKLQGVQMLTATMQGEFRTDARADGKQFIVRFENIDNEYLPILQIPMVEGRNFSKEFHSDTAGAALVNEAFVRNLGWRGSAIGKRIDFLNGKKCNLQIIGVVKDYHYENLKSEIGPQIFLNNPSYDFGRFIIKMDPGKIPRTIKDIEKIYHALIPYHPFDYDFMDQINRRNYASESRWIQIIAFAGVLTILISCIGLFGLAMLSAEKRTKEIGIRKVLGASVGNLVGNMSKDFLKLVLISLFLAFPIAWLGADKWFADYPYRISLSWWMFALPALVVIIIALATVSIQAIKTAVANPISSLRTE